MNKSLTEAEAVRRHECPQCGAKPRCHCIDGLGDVAHGNHTARTRVHDLQVAFAVEPRDDCRVRDISFDPVRPAKVEGT